MFTSHHFSSLSPATHSSASPPNSQFPSWGAPLCILRLSRSQAMKHMDRNLRKATDVATYYRLVDLFGPPFNHCIKPSLDLRCVLYKWLSKLQNQDINNDKSHLGILSHMIDHLEFVVLVLNCIELYRTAVKVVIFHVFTEHWFPPWFYYKLETKLRLQSSLLPSFCPNALIHRLIKHI